MVRSHSLPSEEQEDTYTYKLALIVNSTILGDLWNGDVLTVTGHACGRFDEERWIWRRRTTTLLN
jgi:hypothetical protein